MEQKSLHKCYLCGNELADVSKAQEVPTTDNEKVYTHLSCLEFYLSQSNKVSACGGCSGDKGCC